jgi:hypothetical protein
LLVTPLKHASDIGSEWRRVSNRFPDMMPVAQRCLLMVALIFIVILGVGWLVGPPALRIVRRHLRTGVDPSDASHARPVEMTRCNFRLIGSADGSRLTFCHLSVFCDEFLKKL